MCSAIVALALTVGFLVTVPGASAQGQLGTGSELMHALEQDGLITSEQYTPYEREAAQVVSGLLAARHGR